MVQKLRLLRECLPYAEHLSILSATAIVFGPAIQNSPITKYENEVEKLQSAI